MSTNNFVFNNICVIVHDGDDQNDDALFDMDVSMWRDELTEKIKGFIIPDKDSWTRQREAYILGEVQLHKANGEYYGSVYATYKSGYYVAACLDWSFERAEYMDESKTLDAKALAIGKRIAKVLKTFGTEVKKVAQFSNGEAVYEKVK